MQNVSKIKNSSSSSSRQCVNETDYLDKLQHLTPSNRSVKKDKHQIESKMAQYGRILKKDASSGKLLSTGRKINDDCCKENNSNNICDNTHVKKKQFISSSFVVPSYCLTSRAS